MPNAGLMFLKEKKINNIIMQNYASKWLVYVNKVVMLNLIMRDWLSLDVVHSCTFI